MSGGVGPTCKDISLPKEQEQEHKQVNDLSKIPQKSPFLSFKQLNCLAIIIILSATGMVSPQDVSFVLFSFIYIHLLSRLAFPPLPHRKLSVFNPKSRILRTYVLIAAIIGLFAPIIYIFEGILEGDKDGIKAAIPHVFLLASQVFMEGVAFSDRFSLPISVFVPVCYNSMRILTIIEWLKSEFSKGGEEVFHGGSSRRLYMGRGLALANLGFWSFNLFGFLLPVYLPRAFKLYYTEINKVKG